MLFLPPICTPSMKQNSHIINFQTVTNGNYFLHRKVKQLLPYSYHYLPYRFPLLEQVDGLVHFFEWKDVAHVLRP